MQKQWFADVLEVGVLENFEIFTRKHLWCSRFSIKLQALLKRDSTQWSIAKFLKIPFFTEYLRWLLVHINRDGDNAREK